MTGTGRAARGEPVPEPAGGDPACWLSRVCPACGRLAEEEPPTRCRECGEAIPAG